MMRTHWTGLDLDEVSIQNDPLAYSLPGDTPGQTADIDALHEIFHEQTKQHRATARGLIANIRAHLENPALIARCVNGRHRRAGPGVALPEPTELSGTLGEVLAARTTTRRSNLGGVVTATELSSLLHYAVRANRTARPEATPDLVQTFRPYPSAGGLYPCEIYLAIRAVEGIPSGQYRYDSLQHDLLPCRSVQEAANEDLDYASAETGAGGDTAPPCALIISSVFERSVRKYDIRGYRLAVIEAGHILQNLSLVATGLGLASLVSASFYEAELERLINIDGVSEAVLVSFLVGQDTGN